MEKKRVLKSYFTKSLWLWSIVFLFQVGAGHAWAEDSDASLEYQVKAVMLYRMVKYIEWPDIGTETPDSVFSIGVLGQGPMLKALKSLENQKAKNKLIQVVLVKSLSDFLMCQIVFVEDPESEVFKRFITGDTKPILTVGESSSDTGAGEMLHLYKKRGKIKFSIDVDLVKRSGLKISSRLLQLAKVVGRK